MTSKTVRYAGHKTDCPICGRTFTAKSPKGKYCRPKCQVEGLRQRVEVQRTRREFMKSQGIKYHRHSLGKKGAPPLGLSEGAWAVVSDPKRTVKEKWDALSLEDRERVLAELRRVKTETETTIRSMTGSPASA